MNIKHSEMIINNIIYNSNLHKELEKGTIDCILDIEFLQELEKLITTNNNFIDSYISSQIYTLINYCRFNLIKKYSKEEIYNISNNIITKTNIALITNNSDNYYFNQAIYIRNIDPYFIHGDAKYYAKEKREYIYMSLSYDYNTYKILSSKQDENSEFMKKIKSYHPYSDYINLITYSIRYLMKKYPDIFNNRIILKNIQQIYEIETKFLQIYENNTQQDWYMELNSNAKTLKKII